MDALDGGETFTGRLDPMGATGLTDVIFEYLHYVDVGSDGGGVRLGNTNITTPANLVGSNVQSAGNFLGSNGTINWNANSFINPGSQICQTDLTFSSNQPFGALSLIQYLDEDVLGVSDDHLVALGTPGMDDFQLLTIDDNNDVGVSHAANYSSATGMNYIGWAADGKIRDRQ